MFRRRRIETSSDWIDEDGIKLYTVSASGEQVDQSLYLPRLSEMKATRPICWKDTAAFAIFHDGATARYLVLGWWGNDNELFTSVSVRKGQDWLEDRERYSFCLWDMEILWAERNIFVETIYCENPDIEEYRRRRLRVESN